MIFKAIKRTIEGWGPFGNVWAGAGEIEAQGLDVGRDASGVVIGSWNGRPLVDTSLRPAAVLGPARSGKGASVFVPTMLTWRESAVVIDVNGELSSLSETWRRSSAKNAIRHIRFDRSGQSDGYNFVAAIRRDTTNECDDINDLVVALAPDAAVDPALLDQVRAVLVLGIVAIRGKTAATLQDVDEAASVLPNSSAVLYAYRKYAINVDLYQTGETAATCFARLAFSEQCRVVEVARRLIAEVLSPVADPSAAAGGVDLDQLLSGDTPTTVFITVMAHEFAHARRWIQTFLTQIIGRGKSEDQHGTVTPLLIALDAFEALGRFDFLFETMEFLPARGIKLLVAAQSLASAGDGYGIDEGTWSMFSIRTILPVRDPRTAVALADEIVAGSRKTSTPRNSRAAITADELRSMRALDAVILGATDKPIYTSMLRFYEDAVYRCRSAIQPSQPS